jgi:hypothetical protein
MPGGANKVIVHVLTTMMNTPDGREYSTACGAVLRRELGAMLTTRHVTCDDCTGKRWR